MFIAKFILGNIRLYNTKMNTKIENCILFAKYIFIYN